MASGYALRHLAHQGNANLQNFQDLTQVVRVDFCTEIDLFDAGVHNTIVHFAKNSPTETCRPLRVRRWGESREQFESNTDALPTASQSKFGLTVFRRDATGCVASRSGISELGEICYISVSMVIHCDEKKAQGLFKAEDLISETRDKAHPKPYVEGKDILRWCVHRVRYLEYGTKRAPRMFRRPTFPQLHEAKERLLAARMCGTEPAVAFDNQQRFSNHTVIIFVPWHELRDVRNKSIKKTAKYRKEAKLSQVPAYGFREDLEELSRKFLPKYLLAVMNSSVAREFLNQRRRSKLDIYPDDWKKLPIATIPHEKQMELVRLVDRVLGEFRQKGSPLPGDSANRVAELEAEINERVAALYGL